MPLTSGVEVIVGEGVAVNVGGGTLVGVDSIAKAENGMDKIKAIKNIFLLIIKPNFYLMKHQNFTRRSGSLITGINLNSVNIKSCSHERLRFVFQ